MKRIKLITAVAILAMLCSMATGCAEETDKNQGTATVSTASNSASQEASSQTAESKAESESAADNTRLGDYGIEIKDCRIDKDYEGEPVAIITYGFTNYDEDAAAFYTSVTATVFQSGVGLNEAYFLDDDSDYNSDNQTKEIKNGVTLDVEVAYELNDTVTDLEVEVTEWISFSDDKITKTFKIAE